MNKENSMQNKHKYNVKLVKYITTKIKYKAYWILYELLLLIKILINPNHIYPVGQLLK